MTAFWLGLASLLAAGPRGLAAAGLATIGAGLLFSNRSWEDKSFYLASRAPASAACLREWRHAPPGCHDLVFQWGKGDPGEFEVLARPLERLGLSVFGPHRTYLLQGDVAVGRVSVEKPALPAFLSRNGVTPADPKDFHRLHAVLAPGASVTWRVDLPSRLEAAQFQTHVRAAPGEDAPARGASVSLAGQNGARVLVPAGSRVPLMLDLGAYAGRSVILRILSEETVGGTNLVFEAPRIEIKTERDPDSTATPES